MSVYNKDGELVSTLYNKAGSSILSAYDIEGNPVFGAANIRVMSYNVGGWYLGNGGNVPANEKDFFYSLQTGIIEDNDPDVLVIQEYLANFSADGTSAKTMLESLFPYVHVKTSGTYYGRAVCSKYPISNYVERTYTQEPNRYFDSCTITVNGVGITFVDTHLGLTRANRAPEAIQLCNYVKTVSGPYVICGDFNSPLYDPFSEGNKEVYDGFLAEDCTLANGGAFGILDTACNSADWANDKFAIDNIIVSSAGTIEDVWTDLTKTTDSTFLADGKIDHIPLIAELAITGD